MTEYQCLQSYWWVLISVLGALLVFLMLVQGGQTMLFSARTALDRTMMVNSLGRKWELTFTTLVVFGGAFFASFPLFYSTSFGGAYWLWMLLLFSFIVQAVSYEYRTKPGNLYGASTYDAFLFVNGCVGCILVGVAVGGFFFGADFEVTRSSILDSQSPVISRWATSHGLEAIASWRNLLLGVMILFLARTQAALYFINNIDGDEAFTRRCRRRVAINGAIFVVLFLVFAAVLFTTPGYETQPDGSFTLVPNKFLFNYIQMWWCLAVLVVGVVLVLLGIGLGAFSPTYRRGIWLSGTGTVLVVLTLFWVAGFNNTPYYPSNLSPASSLTIFNSSSSPFTLKVMAWVSVLIPFVVAYIAYVWRKMDTPSITPSEMESSEEKY